MSEGIGNWYGIGKYLITFRAVSEGWTYSDCVEIYMESEEDFNHILNDYFVDGCITSVSKVSEHV